MIYRMNLDILFGYFHNSKFCHDFLLADPINRFGKSISKLFSRVHVRNLDCLLEDLLPDEMVPHINVLRPFV
jgi:hypothetical protein